MCRTKVEGEKGIRFLNLATALMASFAVWINRDLFQSRRCCAQRLRSLQENKGARLLERIRTGMEDWMDGEGIDCAMVQPLRG